MKKRISTFLLALLLCFSIIPAKAVLAADNGSDNSAETNEIFSPWAQADLIIGDTYGIYPQTWYVKGMKAPIKQEQFRVLLAGLRCKLIDTGCITGVNKTELDFNDGITVKDVLNALYQTISGYQYKGGIGLGTGAKPVDYMLKNGIFTGKNGELALKDTCSVEQACVFATRLVTYIYNALDAASKGFLWEIQNNGNKVYLLGSIHLASYDIYPFSEKMLKAFSSSDALAVELNLLDTEGAMSISQYGMYSDGTALKDHVSKETYQKTTELAAKLGYTEDQICMLKPWLIYSLFSSLSGTDSGSIQEASTAAGLGIDMKFTIDALLYKKPILEIEGYEKQAKMLDSFSAELQEYLLSSTVDSLNQVIAGTVSESTYSLDHLLKYWHDGDVDSFLKEISPSYDMPDFTNNEEAAKYKKVIDEFKDKLFTQRDLGMADYIDKLLKADQKATYFVVVGSGHYISNHSVLDILKEKGYTVSQVK